MASEYLHPTVRRCYEYQPNALMCWAAVGLTLWRTRHGRQGRGHDVDTLMNAPGGHGARYARMLDYAGALNEEMGGGTDLSDLPRAEAAVRRDNLAYAQVPSGLPASWANDFFVNVLGTRTTALGPTTSREALKTLIRAHAPLAIFLRHPGHLKLVVGYWDGGENDPASPQILMFNPEAYILAVAGGADYGDDTVRSLREERWLWPHWLAHHAAQLVNGCCWHY